MSDMRSWKSFASSTSSRLKDYVAQRELRIPNAENRQTWREWAGEKITYRRSSSNPGIEKIALFPGWAARSYISGKVETEAPFEVDVYVSGFATLHRPPEFASRSQRAFMRLAKSFAALPKLEDDPATPSALKSTEELLKGVKLPARPNEMTEEFEIEALEKQFRHLNRSESSLDDAACPPSPISTEPNTLGNQIASDLRKFHANFESRLQPFWSSVLDSRTVRVQLYPKVLHATQDSINYGPIASTHVHTEADGSFQAKFKLKWEDICQHPGALHIAFGQPDAEHEILAHAKLLPETLPPNATGSVEPGFATATARIPLTYSPLRVISDIDDTVKHSDVLGGARTVFYNVFVRELNDLVIAGMGEWYTWMWNKGVRFHYISNGPFELLPVLGDFFTAAQLPPGSIKLKSYAGRSLFSGFLSAPAGRKRTAILDVLNAFPHSQFILIGDTGEADMELYAEFASQRPKQISAVFIRQADSNNENCIPLDDPTGGHARAHVQTPELRSASSSYFDLEATPIGNAGRRTSSMPYTPRTAAQSASKGDYFGLGPDVPITNEPEAMPSISVPTPRQSSAAYPSRQDSAALKQMGEVERKRYELQMRVWTARLVIPRQIVFRVFRDPKECAEDAEVVLRGLGK